MTYDHKQIAKELIDTALGNAYYGNALYVARDFQFLTDEDRFCLCRWLDGSQCKTDHVWLQDIAIKILADGG